MGINKKYAVTFGISVYNNEETIHDCLLSALNQTFDDIEYLIINDKGKDNTIKIINDILASHPKREKVRIISHEYNMGVWATRNDVINNAHGEYLFFLDGDDCVTPDCIKILYNAIINEPVDFVVASYKCVEQEANKIIKSIEYPYIKLSDNSSILKYQYCNKNHSIHLAFWNKIYNRDFLISNNILCLEKTIFDDLYFSTLLFNKATSCKLISDFTLYYNTTNSSSISNSIVKNISDDALVYIINSCEFQKKDLLEHKNQPHFKGYFIYVLGRFYSFYIKILLNKNKNGKEYCKRIKLIALSLIKNNIVPFLKSSVLLKKYLIIFIPLPYSIKSHLYRFFTSLKQ